MPRTGLCSRWGGRVLPLLLAYICYLLLGATIFQLLEKQAESQSRDRFQFEKLRFLENYTCLDQQAVSHHPEPCDYYAEERGERELYFKEAEALFQRDGEAV